MAALFRITGKQAAIEAIRREIEQDTRVASDPGVSVGAVKPIIDNSALRKPLGLEPFTYFVIAFSAHLAAELTADMIRHLIAEKVAKSPADITVDEGKDDRQAEQPTPTAVELKERNVVAGSPREDSE